MRRNALLISAVLIFFFLSSCEKEKSPVVSEGTAPDFALSDLSGKEVRLSGQRGKVVMVEFWATWCPPCRESAPVLEGLYRKYKDKGFTILAISIDKGRDVNAAVKSFVNELSISYPVLVDTEDVYLSYKIINVPSSFILDKNGRIVHRHVGYPAGMGELLSQEIEALI